MEEDDELDPSDFVRPTQESLDLVVGGAHRVQVCELELVDGRFLPRVLLTIDDRARLDELLHHLQILESDDFRHCMCMGSLLVQFIAFEGVVASLTLHHGTSVRWDDAWGSDATLRDGRGLARWLADQGIPQLLKELERADADALKYQIARALASWSVATPRCLHSFFHPRAGWPLQPESIAQMLAALDAAYDSEQHVVLALCEWLGMLAARWDSTAVFECVPEKLLNEFGAVRILEALEGAAFTARQTEGAARYLIQHAEPGGISESGAEVLRTIAAAVRDPSHAERIHELIGGR